MDALSYSPATFFGPILIGLLAGSSVFMILNPAALQTGKGFECVDAIDCYRCDDNFVNVFEVPPARVCGAPYNS